MEAFTQVNKFDNLSCLSFYKVNKGFPAHYHDTYCFTLIRQGIECIQFGAQRFYGEAGQLTISHPYEVHTNPIVQPEGVQQFDTFYLSGDVIRYFSGNKLLYFPTRKITNSQVNKCFLALKEALIHQHHALLQRALQQFITALLPYHEADSQFVPIHSSWEQIDAFIQENLHKKLSLATLARIVGMDKYNFSKRFKIQTGMSPMHYVLMQKVLAAKEAIQPMSELTHIAYLYDFTDMAHFSKTFKRFIGIAPTVYQKGLIE